MTTPEGRPGRPRTAERRTLVALALTFVVAALVGAYLDWTWWHASSGIMLTLAAGAILLVAGILALVSVARPVAVVGAIVGVGLLAGQNLGPSRPALYTTDAVVTVTLSSPRATSGSITGTCTTSDDPTELQVSADPNLRLDIFPDNASTPSDVDQREFLGASLAVGDRWGPVRPDDSALDVIIGRVEADSGETRLTAGPSSTLNVDWTAERGRATFSGLVRDAGVPDATGELVDLAGTMEWTCGPRIDAAR